MTPSTTKPPLFGLAHAHWQEHGNAPYELLSELAKLGWRSVYSGGALSVYGRGHEIWKKAGLLPRVDDRKGVRVCTPGKALPIWPRFPWLSQIAINAHVGALRKFVRKKPTEPTIAFVFHPKMEPYVRALGADILIFWVVDTYPFQDSDWSPAKQEQLMRVANDADILMTGGWLAAEAIFGDVPSHCRLLPAGAHSEAIIGAQGVPCPSDLKHIPTPRIGYVGALNPKIDFEMIQYTAARRPDWSWVLIGPESMNAKFVDKPEVLASWNRCKELPNVHFLGPRRYSEVTSYLYHMDVNTICYRTDFGPWTQTAYPFKLHECLAVGRPVVSADLPEIRRHADVVGLAGTPSEWLEQLDVAVNGGVGDTESRRAVALENTWTRRGQQVSEWLQQALDRT